MIIPFSSDGIYGSGFSFDSCLDFVHVSFGSWFGYFFFRFGSLHSVLFDLLRLFVSGFRVFSHFPVFSVWFYCESVF